MKKKFNKGYSQETAREYIEIDELFVCVTVDDFVKKYDVENEKYTDEVVNKVFWFSQKNLSEPFKVKFEDIDLEIPQFSKVKLLGLTACEINKKVYFKADGVEVVK